MGRDAGVLQKEESSCNGSSSSVEEAWVFVVRFFFFLLGILLFSESYLYSGSPRFQFLFRADER